MKSTGMIRRVDDMGRIAIPGEVRRALRIKEGDMLEVFEDGEGGVTFRKYIPENPAIQRLCDKLCEAESSPSRIMQIQNKCEELRLIVGGVL